MNEIRAVVIESGRPAVIDTIATDTIAERIGASDELSAMKLTVVRIYGGLDGGWGTSDNRASMLAYGYPSQELSADTYAIVGVDPDNQETDIPLILAGMLTGTITTIANALKEV